MEIHLACADYCGSVGVRDASLATSVVMGFLVFYLNAHGFMKGKAASSAIGAGRLVATVLMGGLVYFSTAALLRPPELSFLGDLFRTVMGKLKANKDSGA